MTATRKPRNVTKVTPYVRPDGAKRCKVELVETDGTPATVALHDLTRPELQRAAALVFPSIPANVWIRHKSDVIQGLIRDNDEAAATRVTGAAPAPKPVPTTPVATSTPVPASTPVPSAPVAQPGPAEMSTADQLAALLGDLAKPADVEALKAELRAEGDKLKLEAEKLLAEAQAKVQEMADEVRITRVSVVLPDGERKLPEVHHYQLPKLVAVLATGRHAFLVGPAGTGKSVAAKQAAETLGRGFQSISFGPTTPTSKLFGYNDANGRFIETPLYQAYTAGEVFCGDELDNGHAGLLAEQNQFLANGHCAFANGMAERHKDFVYVATGNTYGKGGDRLFVGRNQLDAATLDRFVFIPWGVDENIEEHAALAMSTNESAPACREWIQTVRRVRSQVEDQKLQMVVSPRASIDGCALITTGAFTRSEVIEMVLFKGAGESITSKLQV